MTVASGRELQRYPGAEFFPHRCICAEQYGLAVGDSYKRNDGVVQALISTGGGSGSVARGINDFNTIVGYCNFGYRGGQTGHGFIHDSNGDFEALDLSGQGLIRAIRNR